MKEWRERKGPGTLTDFVDPDTANNTPARKRGRIQAVARAKQNQRIAEALAARNLANSTGSNSPADDNSAQGTAAPGDPGHATRDLEHRLFGTAAADVDDAEDLGEDTKKFLMKPRPSTGASQKSGSAQPSPGDIEFLRQCDRFRLEEGNKVSEEPPKKRRAPRRSKEEMEKVRAEKEAARLKREAARAAKLAALGAKQQPKKNPKVAVKKEEAGTPRQPTPLFQPAAPSNGHERTIDFNDIPLFPGAAMPNMQINSAQATNAPTYNRPGSMTAVPSTRVTPAPDAFARTQRFDTPMSYQAPANQISLPSFQTLLREPPLQIPQPSNFHYQMPPTNYGFGHGFDMLGHYPQHMGGNNFNFGMQQHGYMQPGMNNMPQPNHYPLDMNSMFDMGPIYDSSQDIHDQQLASDATVVCDGAIKTEPGSEQQTATDSQSYMQLLAPTGTQPAPMAPMDVQPAATAPMGIQVAPLAPMEPQPFMQTQTFMAIQSDIQPQSDIQLQSDIRLQSDIQPQSSIESQTSNSAQTDNGGAHPDTPVADLVPGSSAGRYVTIMVNKNQQHANPLHSPFVIL